MEAREATSTPPAGSRKDERQARTHGKELAHLAQSQPQALQSLASVQEMQSAGPLKALERLQAEIEVLRRRQDAYEPRLAELAGELTGAREFRERAEVELSSLQMGCAALAAVVDEMTQLPAEIRSAFEPELSEVRRELRRQLPAGGRPPADAAPADAGTAVDEPLEAVAGGSVVAADGPGGDSVEPAEMAARELVPPRFLAPEPERRSSWLAPAIEAIATKRSPALAADLICELLPFHGALWDGELSYLLEIEEHDAVHVQIAAGSATIAFGRQARSTSPDFRLCGSAAAFASLAGGGAPRRRPAGVRVRGSRLAARRLLASCAAPVALHDLVKGGVAVWPGLLLAALAEAVDPRWTIGSSFTIAYEIEDADGAAFHVLVRDGAPISVVAADPAWPSSQSVVEGEGPASSAERRPVATTLRPEAVIRASERAFLAMVAGAALPDGQSVTIIGDDAPVLELLRWFARAQGLVAAPADS